MEVVNWVDSIEPDTEETEVSLRGRLPRHLSAADGVAVSYSSAVISDHDRDGNGVKSSESSSDESRSSTDGEEKVNGKPSSGVFDGKNGNGAAKPTNGHHGLDKRYDDFLVSDEIPTELAVSFETNDLVFQVNEVAEIKEDDNNGFTVTESSALSSHVENGVHASSASNEAVRYMEAQLREKIEEEFRALYLEKLTDRKHEFYCPNCKACITKVLVAKNSEEESAAVPEQERVRESFRCTSCFSFLIPIGNWLFPSWRIGDEDREANFSNQVSSDRFREPMLDQNSRDVPEQSVVPNATAIIEIHERNTEYVNGVNETVQPIVNTVTATIEIPERNAERVIEAVGPAQSRPWSSVLFGQKIKASINGKTPVTEEPIGVAVPTPAKPDPHSSEINVVQEQAPASIVVSAAITPLGSDLETGFKGEMYDKIFPVLDQTRGDVLIGKSKPSEIDVAVSTKDVPPLQEVIVHSRPKLDEGLAEAAPTESVPVIVASRDTTLLVPAQDSPKSWEIAKSIVYGGLVESITSLGIVTSAASGDVTTVNIIVLALANLIGGLFVIVHNIWDLKVEQSTMRCSRTNRVVDKYHQTLGRRENFFLHATFVILSFLVFGLIPPVVYGLTFRETDDKDFKLAAVGAASLVCIAILAAGKAYIQRPSKYIKTIMYYIVIGFSVSGASYLAGELIRQILEKVNSSESTMSLAMPLPGTGSVKGNWGSY